MACCCAKPAPPRLSILFLSDAKCRMILEPKKTIFFFAERQSSQHAFEPFCMSEFPKGRNVCLPRVSTTAKHIPEVPLMRKRCCQCVTNHPPRHFDRAPLPSYHLAFFPTRHITGHAITKRNGVQAFTHSLSDSLPHILTHSFKNVIGSE